MSTLKDDVKLAKQLDAERGWDLCENNLQILLQLVVEHCTSSVQLQKDCKSLLAYSLHVGSPRRNVCCLHVELGKRLLPEALETFCQSE